MKAARDLYSQSLSMYPLKTEDPASAKEYSVILANRDGAGFKRQCNDTFRLTIFHSK